MLYAQPLPLERGIIYGPILSRRLGRSLGVNLLPTHAKLCSFDCLYCHYGRTSIHTLEPASHLFPHSEQVIRAVERFLRTGHPIDTITFSGNGEPTLHPAFTAIAREIRRLRDRYAPHAQLALFSNATTLVRPEIRAALSLFDLPMLKLDAADPETFSRLNRPAEGVHLEAILEALRAIPDPMLQCVWVDGVVSNVRDTALRAWCEAIRRIRPRLVQVYSTDYPVAVAGVERVPPYRLRALAEEIAAETGVEIRPYAPGPW